MPSSTNITEFLEKIDPYVQQSAIYASEHFLKNGINLSFFEGTKMDMTPEFCATLYRELIRDLISYQRMMGTNYGLYAAIIPERQNKKAVSISVQLGLVFPFDPSSQSN